MSAFIIRCALGAAGGAAIAALNDLMLRTSLKRKPEALAFFYILRQVFNVLYLAALYLISSALEWNAVPLLVGGALGITLPSIFFTRRLVRMNDAMKANGKPENGDIKQRKEREKNG